MYLTIRIDEEYKKKIQKYAKKNNMTMTSYIKMSTNEQILKEDMQEAKKRMLNISKNSFNGEK